jgi:hypothetical protein
MAEAERPLLPTMDAPFDSKQMALCFAAVAPPILGKALKPH